MEQRRDSLMGKSHVGLQATPQLCLRAALVLDGDAGYDEARKVWNGAIDKKPAMIAYCADVQDVAKGIGLDGQKSPTARN